MDRYIYPAIFHCGNDGYSITFPDLPGCFSCGSNLEEAFQMAKEALELHIFGLEEDGDLLPVPTDPKTIVVDSKTSFITLIEAYMPLIRNKMENKLVKKTLTIPKWLNDLAEEKDVNFSQLLKKALKQHLGISNEE